mmetsp:Transcript_12760/g.20078  ORF Transcript_12760/g.20078 Transcript_12760/m.20078 type:complete len:87 (-) Transcript_12760:72-332(-)
MLYNGKQWGQQRHKFTTPCLTPSPQRPCWTFTCGIRVSVSGAEYVSFQGKGVRGQGTGFRVEESALAPSMQSESELHFDANFKYFQ